MQVLRDWQRRGFSDQMVRDALSYYYGGQISWGVNTRNRTDNTIREQVGRQENTAIEWALGDNQTGITIVGETLTRT